MIRRYFGIVAALAVLTSLAGCGTASHNADAAQAPGGRGAGGPAAAATPSRHKGNQSATLYLAPSSLVVAPNTDFSVAIRVSSSDPANAVAAVLEYPTDGLVFEGVTVNDATWEVRTAATGGAGALNVQVATSTPVSGDQLVATATFRSVKDATVQFTPASAVASAATATDQLGVTTGGVYKVASAKPPHHSRGS